MLDHPQEAELRRPHHMASLRLIAAPNPTETGGLLTPKASPKSSTITSPLASPKSSPKSSTEASPKAAPDILVKIVPPQTAGTRTAPTRGAYSFVIDVSGSMNSAAEVTNDDGDKVSHGFSLLDIAKHATSTFVDCLGDDDLVSIVAYTTYASQ